MLTEDIMAADRGACGFVMPRAGFGCACLMANVDRASSSHLLSTAFDHGITHFDTARSYGYGESETVLGEFARSRRDQITITTKFGISPPPRQLATGRLKAFARGIARVVPSLRPLLRKGAMSLTRGGVFDAATATASLETSLRALRTDHVDVLLMHEPDLPSVCGDEMTRFREDCVTSGKARVTGVAGPPDMMSNLLGAAGADVRAVQFVDGLTLDTDLLVRSEGRMRFTHSVITAGLAAIQARFAERPTERARWQDELGGPCDDAMLTRLLIASALERNRDGCVILSSRSPDRVAANGRIVSNHASMTPQVAVLHSLLRARG